MTEPTTKSHKGLLAAIAVALLVLTGVFGYRTIQQRRAYRDYKTQTEGGLPWQEGESVDVDTCVDATVRWGMECTGLESWCLNEAPRLTMECMATGDRASFCEAQGDEVLQTTFGYAQCEQMREQVEGRYTKRAHKKYCAAVYRAVAEHCRQERAAPAGA